LGDSAVHTFTVGITQLIKPEVTNELRANYSIIGLGTDFDMDDFGGAVPLPDSLLFPMGFSSKDSGFLLLINGVGEYGQGKAATDEQRQVNLIDNLSVTKAGHQLKFGGDYRWLAPFSSPFSYRPFVQFLGSPAPRPHRPARDTPSQERLPAPPQQPRPLLNHPHLKPSLCSPQNFAFYGQDYWKITRD